MAHPKSSAVSKPTSRQFDAELPKRVRGKALPPDGNTPELAPDNGYAPVTNAATTDIAQSRNAVAHPKMSHEAAIGQSSAATYDVGYKKPPKHTQFKKGQSGNPKGRVKGSRNTSTIFEEESQKKVAVTENGKTRNLTKRELVMINIINKAIKGDDKAQIKFLKLDERFSGGGKGRGGPSEAASVQSESIAELSAADRLILERYRSIQESSSADNDNGPDDPSEDQA